MIRDLLSPERRPLTIQALLLLALAALALLAALVQTPSPAMAVPAPSRVLLAVVLLVAWLTLSAGWLRRRRPARSPAAGEGALLVAYASQTGFAEQLARRSAESLQAAGVATRLLPLAELDRASLVAAERALFLVSTTGEGDAPDNAFRFLHQVMAVPVSLPGLRYGLLALGDRGYPQFCGFGRQLDDWLQRQGAQRLFERVEVDNADAGALGRWQQWLRQLGAAPLPEWRVPDYLRWRLVERRQLNPGSVGGAVFHLAFEPLSETAHWQAGDIAELRLPEPGAAPGHRDYSIASLPVDGRLELLVRLMRDAEGRPGHGSGWLCERLGLGGEVALRVRENCGFRLRDEDAPLILIGNGTGLAGLRALLKARIAAGRHRNWLLFGERDAAHDHFHRAELEAWQASGALRHADYAWSRDPRDPAYVQQRLHDRAARLRDWAGQGAAIHVCGSAEGMAPAVDAVLRRLLGEATVDALIADGRYRRDVY